LRLKDIIYECRPHQYLKNSFVLIGPMFYAKWDFRILWQTLLVFVAFSAMASAVYWINDIFDVDLDRLHPTKRQRPIAAKRISITFAYRFVFILFLISTLISYTVSYWALSFIIGYAAINILYSLKWKHVPVIDVFIISFGFMLRILAGTMGLGITTSSWLVLCGLMLTLFLGFSKRQAELMSINDHPDRNKLLSRKVLDDYSPAMIEQFMAISAACTIISYSLYTVSQETITKHHTSDLFYTVPFVIYGIFRYIYLLHKKNGGQDTARDLLFDRHMLITGISWIILTTIILTTAR